jgi:hypothetical protein
MPTLYIKLASYALVALLAFAGGWKIGSALKDRQILALQTNAQEAREKQLAANRLIEQAQEQKEAIAAALEIERNKAAQVITKEVIRDVIKYVQKPSSQSVCLDSDGVRLLNTAATRGVPESTDSTSTPNATAAAVVASVTDNYATCHTNANQLSALQDWVRTIQ